MQTIMHKQGPSITYVAEAKHVDIHDYQHTLKLDSIGDAIVSLETKDGLLTITVAFLKLYTNQRVKIGKVTHEYVKRITELVSSFISEPIAVPQETVPLLDTISSVVTEVDGTSSICITELIGVGVSPFLEDSYDLLDDRKPLLSTFINDNINEIPALWHEYYAALSCTDTVAKFMMLYNIMLQIHGDIQDKVDNAIDATGKAMGISITSFDKPVHQQPKYPRRDKESIYTKARNQIAHKRGDTKLNESRKLISENIGTLNRIAQQMIIDHLK